MPSRKPRPTGRPGTPWTGAMATVRPMLATLAAPGAVSLTSDRLVYEPKYDGIRALVAIEPGTEYQVPGTRGVRRPVSSPQSPVLAKVTIWSRNGHDKTAQFPDLVHALGGLVAKRGLPLLLDGEIVALDERGRPASFTRLQPRIHVTGAKAIAEAARAQSAVYVAFDLLREGDLDLRRLPLTARRLRLQRAFRPPAHAPLRLSEMAVGDARALYARAEREGWEGLIAKVGASIYEAGRRSPAWRKIKILQRQAFAVGGWTEGRLSRAHFGALLLGTWKRSSRAARSPGPGARSLVFVGAVGTGFDDKELARLASLLRAREVKASPFADPPKTAQPAHWVKPELVAEVKYTEFTPDGRLRHPVYLGLRDDKGPGANSLERTRNGQGAHAERTRKQRQDPTAASSRDIGTRAGSATDVGSAFGRTSGRLKPASTGRETSSGDSGLRSVMERLRELEDARKDGWLDLPDGHRLHVTNLWKIFWPELKITKGDLLRYYTEVAPFVLPAVADRPLVMKRFPNGVHGKAFYQQRVLVRPPAGVRVEALPEGVDPIGEDDGAGHPRRFVGGSLVTLLYMAQMAAISQDPWFSTVRAPLDADQVAIDLDPGAGATWQTVVDVARWVRDEIERLHMPGVPKTSGSRGLHIYVPLPPGTSYETGQLLCQIVATLVSSKHPKHATVERMVAKRPAGTVYVDYLQNILGKTLATAYSARASDFAGVSTPITWRELDEGVDGRAFTIRSAPARFRKTGDLWARLRTGRPADLHKVIGRM